MTTPSSSPAADFTGPRVRVEEGVVFGTGGGRELRCDVYYPPVPAEGRPALLLLHGGAWARGDRRQLRGYGILMGRLGYLCVAPEYRLTGEARWPAQIHDVKAALRWMRAQSTKLEIDPRRIAISGNSAGGHLALLAAGTPHLEELEGQGGNPGAGTECAAVIAFYPPTLLRVRGDLERTFGLFEPGVSEETVRIASPLSHVSAGFPPTLLLHGSADTTVPPAASLKMYEALDTTGVPVELHMFSGLPHAFDASRGHGRACAQIMALFLERHGLQATPQQELRPVL